MTKNPKILSIVLAGGEGTRLMPLTRDRAKPAVPFGGVYRLIDFPLSNLVNSGYRQVVVLTENSTVGIDTEHDLARGFTVTPDGITVVPKNTIVDD